ncbi:MAG: Uma2 family endonuclease [Lachnospiraceae bacterium]|nr:Uma2 family endonuclease [Lachnospiraceae bacterium]
MEALENKYDGGPCEVNVAPFAVYLFNDEKNYVEPDVLVVCDPARLDDKGCHGAPDWVIEIVSPSSQQMDYMRKLFAYEKAGVREYWIVDIDSGRLMVYDFEHETMTGYGLDSVVKSGLYDELEINFDKIMKAIG